jgi:hypothetical protein
MQAQTILVDRALGVEVSGKGGNDIERSKRREVDVLEGGKTVGRLEG